MARQVDKDQGLRSDVDRRTPPAALAARYRISLTARGSQGPDRAAALDQETGDRVFLKWSADRDAIAREAAIVAALDHPGIVRLRTRELGAEGGLLVLDLVEGVDLEARLRAGAAMAETDLVKLFADLAAALAAVHAAGIVHRDLKPANIVVRPDGRPVIVDFGAAAKQEDPLGRASLLTDGYAAPEQYRDDQQEGPWTDIYALSALLYRALAGRPPPSAPARARGEPIGPLPGHGAGRHHGVETAIERGLSLDPRARPATVAAWQAWLEGEGASARTGGGPEAQDDYPPTVRVTRRQGRTPSAGGRRTHAATIETSPGRPSTAWRRTAWLAAAGLAALALAWFGRPLHERYVKDAWLVDAAGGGDAATIGEALERARAGSVVTVRQGTYRESLVIERPVRLVAAEDGERPEIVADNAPCLRSGGLGSAIAGLSLRALATGPDAGAAPMPCLLIDGGDLAVETSAIESASGPAIVIDGGAAARIGASEIKASGGAGIEIAGGSRPVLRDNRLHGGDGLAILVRGGAAPVIEDNAIDGGDGVLFVEGAGGRFARNRIRATRGSALRLASGADPEIAANTIEQAGEAGLFVYDGGKGRIEANTISGSRLSGAVIGAGADVVLAGNHIEASGEHGILVLDGGRARLDANRVSGSRGHGIALGWTAEVELGANQLDGNLAPDLFDARLPGGAILPDPPPSATATPRRSR